MAVRRNDYDVTDQVRTTDPGEVRAEVIRIFFNLYAPRSDGDLIIAFDDATRIYHGDYQGYLPCDTQYHNLQHVLDVTLAMARLMDGYERSRLNNVAPLGQDMFRLGVALALFHDVGYIRRQHDTRHHNGAEYTLTHVSRGARFLRDYLDRVHLGDQATLASRLIHFTGYEVPTARIPVRDPMARLLGCMLGSADIVAQMSDRCYLEKCRDRLYPEFVVGGIAVRRDELGGEQVVFSSGTDLVLKTPDFYLSAMQRLETDLQGVYRLAEAHFSGQNLYIEELEKNIRYARAVQRQHDLSMLRRSPPPAQFREIAVKPWHHGFRRVSRRTTPVAA